MWNGKRFSVVFPAHNEEEGIPNAVAMFGAIEAVDEVGVVVGIDADDASSLAATADRPARPECAQKELLTPRLMKSG